MATINDLRSVLLDLEHDELGDPDAVWAEVEAQLKHRPRRLLVPLIAAALVLAVAGAGFALTSHDSGQKSVRGPASSSAAMPVDHYVFTIEGLPAGYTSGNMGAYPDAQCALIKQNDELRIAAVNIGSSANAMGAPAKGADASDALVNGQHGYFQNYGDTRTASLHCVADDLRFSGEPSTVLVWQDVSGLWVAIQMRGFDRDQALQIAAAIQIGRTAPIKIMARFAYLPPGLELSAIGASESSTWTDIEFGPHDSQLDITIAPAGQLNARTQPGIDPAYSKITIGAFSGMYGPNDPSTSLTNGKVDVSILFQQGDPTTRADASTHAMPIDELTKLINGMTVASDPNNQATWFNAADALPH